jgi:5-(carboxyamino)imidazole ribonucleotide synthase
MSRTLVPGDVIGILGGGQLGRMAAIAARRMGYRTVVYTDDSASPGAQWSDGCVVGRLDNEDALRKFGQQVDVITYETEHIPLASVRLLQNRAPVYPSPHVLEVTQHRQLEKEFLANNGFPLPACATIKSYDHLRQEVERIGRMCVLKTATGGYDGKGQWKVGVTPGDLETAWRAASPHPTVLEEWVDLAFECSVIGARAIDGSMKFYGPVLNNHANHILDVSVCPIVDPRMTERLARDAVEIASALMTKLDVVGLLCVEMFVTTDGRLLVNELAPRTHNSGHLTIEGHVTSQFEQLMRIVAGLPLGSVEQIRPAAMANLLGDLWGSSTPAWEKALRQPDVKLHLYGKLDAKPGRKMGHLTATADQAAKAMELVEAARRGLTRESSV